MKRPIAGLRLGVFLLFMLGMLSPFATSGAGAQALTCDDFTSTRAAQAVLDADPSLAADLDADGDGVACNEDESSSSSSNADDEETPADDDRGNAGSDDADAYLADIQDEVDSLQDSVDRFLEIDQIGADATRDEVDELNQIAADWVDYPDVAAGFTAPSGLEDVEDSYLDLADSFSEAGSLWEEYWAIPTGDPGEADALDAFNETFIAAQGDLDSLNTLIADAGDSSTNRDETPVPADETPEAGDDEYLGTIQDELDTLTESFDRFDEIQTEAASGTLTDAELADLADEITGIADDWSAYPDTAAGLDPAPDEYVDVEDAYLDLADQVGEAGDLWAEYWAIPQGDAGEADALDAFNDALTDAQDQIDDVQGLVDDAGDSTTPVNNDPTEEPTSESRRGSSSDADDYVATVSETADDWNASIDRFTEIIGLGADATDADRSELTDIVSSWADAPDVAAEAVAPDGYEDVQSAYEDYADELASAAGFFTDWLGTEADTPEEEEAFNNFIDAVSQSQTLYDDLSDLLGDSAI